MLNSAAAPIYVGRLVSSIRQIEICLIKLYTDSAEKSSNAALAVSIWSVYEYSWAVHEGLFFVDRKGKGQYIYARILLLNEVYCPICNSNKEDIWQSIFT